MLIKKNETKKIQQTKNLSDSIRNLGATCFDVELNFFP